MDMEAVRKRCSGWEYERVNGRSLVADAVGSPIGRHGLRRGTAAARAQRADQSYSNGMME